MATQRQQPQRVRDQRLPMDQEMPARRSGQQRQAIHGCGGYLWLLLAVCLLASYLLVSREALGLAVLPGAPGRTTADAPVSVLYVAPNGRDTNDGSAKAPFATLEQASQVARPGDYVEVHAGTYAPERPQVLTSSGTAEAPIVYEPAPGAHVVIDGTNMPGNPGEGVILVMGAFVRVQGFEIVGGRQNGIEVYDTHDVVIQANVIHGSQRGGITVDGPAPGRVSAIQVLDNVVYDNCRVNAHGSATWPAALSATLASDVRVEGNRVFANFGEGIDLYRVARGYVARNEVHDNFSVEIYLDNARDTTVERNYVSTSYVAGFLRGGTGAAGIMLAREHYAVGMLPLANDVIANNIVLGGSSALSYWESPAGGGMQGCRIVGNTLVGAEQAVLAIDPSPAHRDDVIADNIIVRTGSEQLADVRSATGLAFDHNAFSDSPPAAVAGQGDVVGAPRFVGPGASTPEGYALATNSPLRGAGRAMTELSVDYFGTPRTGRIDIGAVQSSGT